MPACKCSDPRAATIYGVDAAAYADEHLARIDVRAEGEEVTYRCPQSGRIWIEDFPRDDAGARTVRLRWALEHLTPAEVVAVLATEPPLEERLRFAAPDVEFRPFGSDRTYRGVEAAREYALAQERRVDRPRQRALAVTEVDDKAVVVGQVSHVRAGSYVEHVPAAWVFTIRDGRVARMDSYSSWEEARKAAGVGEADRGRERRLADWLKAVASPPRRPRPA